MASPEAIARASSKPMGMMGGGGGGMPPGPDMPPSPPPEAPKAEAPGGGMDAMVGNLEGVGAFIKAQAEGGNPAAEKAMASFQNLLQDMAAMGSGEAGPKPPGATDLEQPPAPEGGIPMNKAPGVKVL